MIGVALTGERSWHASWWEWHGLIVIGYLVIGLAAQREWRDERFRDLYLPTTRERTQEVSVLFGDLAGFTTFSERPAPTDVARSSTRTGASPRRSSPAATAARSRSSSATASSRRSTAAATSPTTRPAPPLAALALQKAFARIHRDHPEWPLMRIGVNSGEVVVREVGGQGHVAYPLLGDAVNTGSRLEGLAPPGGVLIGSATYDRLPDGVVVEERRHLRVKGKEEPVGAYVLVALS